MANRQFGYANSRVIGGFYGTRVQVEIVDGAGTPFVNIMLVDHNNSQRLWRTLSSKDFDGLVTTLNYYRDVVMSGDK